MPFWSRCLAALCASVMTISPALAQSNGEFQLELNKLEAVDGGCRLTFVAFNGTGINLRQTSYDVAVFDETSAVSDRLILEFGTLPENKTRVVQFLLNRGCPQISRLLLNEAEECLLENGQSSPICMQALRASSRENVLFGS
jgi:hypothetical protein